MTSSSTLYHFYRVFDEKGEQYCDCGWEKHAQERVLANRGFSYRRIDAPKPINPETVDVSVTPTEELPGQQGLPSAVERLHDDMRKELHLQENESTPFEL